MSALISSAAAAASDISTLDINEGLYGVLTDGASSLPMIGPLFLVIKSIQNNADSKNANDEHMKRIASHMRRLTQVIELLPSPLPTTIKLIILDLQVALDETEISVSKWAAKSAYKKWHCATSYEKKFHYHCQAVDQHTSLLTSAITASTHATVSDMDIKIDKIADTVNEKLEKEKEVLQIESEKKNRKQGVFARVGAGAMVGAAAGPPGMLVGGVMGGVAGVASAVLSLKKEKDNN